MYSFALEFNPDSNAKIVELWSAFSSAELKIIRDDEKLLTNIMKTRRGNFKFL